MSGDDDFTTVHVTTDRAEAEMLTEALRREGIVARLTAVSSALLGAGPQLFPTEVDVPTASAARAREILAELAYVGASEAADQPEEAAEPAPPSRRPLLGAGIAFLLPGGGHLYARRVLTAVTLEVGVVACLFLLSRNQGRDFAMDAVFGALIAIVICDAVGGWLAARAENRGVHTVGVRQIARGLMVLACAAASGAAAATVVAIPAWWREHQLAKLNVTCTERAIIVSNGIGAARLLTFDRVGVRTPELRSHRAYPVGISGISELRAAAGATVTVGLEVPGEIAAACTSASADGSPCPIIFDLEVIDPGELVPRPLAAVGVCAPVWGTTERRGAGRLIPRRAP